MAKPVLFTVDDDPDVLAAVERDLRRRFGSDYRILRANSGASALDALKQLRVRNDVVALFVVDQRMPEMTGVEFLQQALEIYPDAKRVLLTAYADTEAAIKAINSVKVDYYLLKPWDPPEENLYPVLQDVLDDWTATFRPTFEGLRVIGPRWSPETHDIKEFLARNQVPYQWLDIEMSTEARRLIAYMELDGSQLPLVLYPDGTHDVKPNTIQLAEKVGLKSHAQKPFYDLIIIGGGPAGLAAAVYGASEGLHTVMIEREAPGGQAGTSSRIENYLGFPVGLSGADLARRGLVQAKRFGVEVLTPQEAVGIRIQDQYRFVKLADDIELSSEVVLVATGVSYRRLDVPGVAQLTGAGVYYGAAMSEAVSCMDENVYIVGGANSAGQAAMHFSRYASNVTMVVRGDSLTKSMSQYLIEQIAATPNIRVLTHTNIAEVFGSSSLEAVTIANALSGEVETCPANAMFIFIGATPRTDWLAGVVERDENGFILSGPDVMREGRRPRGWMLDRDPYLLETNVPGIFVAGDVRHRSIKRVASAVGEGSIAVQFIHEYLAAL